MYNIGIDLGGTGIKVGIVDSKGEIIMKDSILTRCERPSEEIIKDMALLAKNVVKESGININEIESIGVGSPGTPDCEKGVILYNNNLNFKNVQVRKIIQEEFDLPVYIDNDANCAALAESFVGGAKDVNDSVTVTLGTGIGGGVIINKKIFNGFNYAAPELGHMVICLNGIECTCGRKGCWERYASATALINQTKEVLQENKDSLIYKMINGDLDKVDAKIPFDAAKKDDAVALKLVKQFTTYLSEGIINIINIFQPEVVLIGGGISREGDYLLNPLRDMVEKGVYSVEYIKNTRIEAAKMGNPAGIIGASILGRSQK